MSILGFFLFQILQFYSYCIIAYVLINMLISFNIINDSNKFVYMILEFLFRITEPFLKRIRNLLPSFGSVDISPVILLILIETIKYGIGKYSI